MRLYDSPVYRRLRWMAKVHVLSGGAVCWRCGKPIKPLEPFDLGHDDHDKTLIRGPEHRRCNRATRGRLRRKSREW